MVRDLRSILGAARFTALDIGARGDIPAPWLCLDGVARIIAFEPDAEACARLRATYDARSHGDMYRVIPTAVSGTGGQRTLYVTNSAGGSSLLSPDTPFMAAYVDHDYVHPLREITVETRTLADALGEAGEPSVQLIKADVQGGEIEVLEGLGDERLRDVLALELEAAVEPQYRNGSTLLSLQSYLASRGFELFDLRPWRAHRVPEGGGSYPRSAFGVHDESRTITPRLIYVDTVFVRRPESLLDSGNPERIRQMLVALCVYRFFSEAWDLVVRAEVRGLFDRGESATIKSVLRSCHDSLAVSRVFHRPTRFWSLMRLASKSAGMVDRIGDEVIQDGLGKVFGLIRTRIGGAFRPGA